MRNNQSGERERHLTASHTRQINLGSQWNGRCWCQSAPPVYICIAVFIFSKQFLLWLSLAKRMNLVEDRSGKTPRSSPLCSGPCQALSLRLKSFHPPLSIIPRKMATSLNPPPLSIQSHRFLDSGQDVQFCLPLLQYFPELLWGGISGDWRRLLWQMPFRIEESLVDQPV